MFVIQKDCYGTVAGVIFVALLILLVAVLFLNTSWLKYVFIAVSVALSCFIIYFFRVPERERPQGDNLVTSVADGKVVIIEKVFEKEYLKRDCIQVSVYMDFFDVHTNFWPFDGVTTYYKYHPGKYLLAFLPKSSELNEHASVGVRYGEDGPEILFKQIAGTFARRIVNYAKEGESFNAADQCGVIKFGSRLDMFLPLDAEICVNIGDRVSAVESVIAKLK